MSLKNLIALQAQKKTTTAQGSIPPESNVVAEAESKTETVTAVPPAAPVKKGLGLNLAKASAAMAKPAESKPQAAKPAPTPAALDGDSFDLNSLAALDAGSIAETNRSESYTSEFIDEIEATAPDRELPADMTAEMVSFVESLDSIYAVLHDSEMFAQSVRMVMLELQENDEYDKLLSDSDIHVMIQGMRRSMGLARVRKQEKSRKGKTQTNARKTSGLSDHSMELLNSLMGGSDD